MIPGFQDSFRQFVPALVVAACGELPPAPLISNVYRAKLISLMI